MESFVVFFYILEQCYFQCKEDDLGGFLGAISPELWEEGMPIDMAVYNDWMCMLDKEEYKEENLISQICIFLEDYERRFDFCFTKTKEILHTDEIGRIQEIAKEKAIILQKKYNYSNW